MDNNFNDNNGNMVGNPEVNNGVDYGQVFDAAKFLAKRLIADKLEKLKKLKSVDFNGPEKFCFAFLTECVDPVAEILGLSETLNVSEHLKVENIDSSEAKNILLAISEVIYDLIQDEEFFNALLGNLTEEQCTLFKENRELLLKLRKEDIKSVVDKLAKMDFFSKIECIFQKIVKGEFKASDLKSVFWDGENTRGKVGKGLAIAEGVVTVFVALSSCFLYVGFLLLDNYIDKKVDAKAKLEYNKARASLIGMSKDLPASNKTQIQTQIKELDKRCSSLSSNFTDKIAELDLKKVNSYDLKKSVLSIVFCLLCPPYLLKKGIALLKKTIDKAEKRKFFEAFKKRAEEKGYVKEKPLEKPSTDVANSTLDNTL